MTHELLLVFHLTVAIGVALACGLGAHLLKQSPIVGYLVAGMIIGPFTPGFKGEREQIAVLSEIGVIFLMFALGAEFSLRELARVKWPAIVGTGLQIIFIIAVGTTLGALLHWPLVHSVVFGAIICISSTMVIIKNLMNRGELASNHGRLLLAMLIVQDLVGVLIVSVIPTISGKSVNAGADLAIVGVKAVIFIGVTLFLGAKVVPYLMGRVEQLRSPELFLMFAVVLALGTASASAMLGLSPVLGAFMGGLMLTETEFDHRVIAELIPMRDLFATLFFVSTGMIIDVGFILSHLSSVLGLAVFIMVAKALLTMGALLPFHLGSKTTAFVGLGMISIGEFNFVIAQAGRRENAISAELFNVILSASLLTILFTPAAFWIAPRVGKLLSSLPMLGKVMDPTKVTPMETGGAEDHAIVVGYGRVGRRMARGLRRAGLHVVVIDNEVNIVRELAGRSLPAIYGDASYESVLAAAHPETARVIAVTLPDFGATRAVVHRARRMNPNVLIVARAQRPENDVMLREAGATAVVVPEAAGAVMLLDETLLLLGLPQEHVFIGGPELTLPPVKD